MSDFCILKIYCHTNLTNKPSLWRLKWSVWRWTTWRAALRSDLPRSFSQNVQNALFQMSPCVSFLCVSVVLKAERFNMQLNIEEKSCSRSSGTRADCRASGFTLGLLSSDLFFRSGFRLHHLFLCGQTDLTLNTSVKQNPATFVSNTRRPPDGLQALLLLTHFWSTGSPVGWWQRGWPEGERPTVAACWLIKQRSWFPFGIFTFTTNILLLLHEHMFKNVIRVSHCVLQCVANCNFIIVRRCFSKYTFSVLSVWTCSAWSDWSDSPQFSRSADLSETRTTEEQFSRIFWRSNRNTGWLIAFVFICVLSSVISVPLVCKSRQVFHQITHSSEYCPVRSIAHCRPDQAGLVLTGDISSVFLYVAADNINVSPPVSALQRSQFLFSLLPPSNELLLAVKQSVTHDCHQSFCLSISVSVAWELSCFNAVGQKLFSKWTEEKWR